MADEIIEAPGPSPARRRAHELVEPIAPGAPFLNDLAEARQYIQQHLPETEPGMMTDMAWALMRYQQKNPPADAPKAEVSDG